MFSWSVVLKTNCLFDVHAYEIDAWFLSLLSIFFYLFLYAWWIILTKIFFFSARDMSLCCHFLKTIRIERCTEKNVHKYFWYVFEKHDIVSFNEAYYVYVDQVTMLHLTLHHFYLLLFIFIFSYTKLDSLNLISISKNTIFFNFQIICWINKVALESEKNARWIKVSGPITKKNINDWKKCIHEMSKYNVL